MSNDAEAQRGQGSAVRHRIRNGRVPIVGRQAALLLLAGVQCKPFRSTRTAVQVYK